MGVQIYIKKAALIERGIELEEVTLEYQRSDEQEGVLAEEKHCNVEGLSLLMGSMDDEVYHDANTWGTARNVLLEFLGKHSLLAGSDWFEA